MLASRVITNRWFFGLCPPVGVSRAISFVRDAYAGPTGLVTNDRLHMTLAITGDYDLVPDPLPTLLLGMAPTFAVAPFDIVLDHVVAGTLRPSHIPPELRDLSRQMVASMRRRGALRPDWSPDPHVTLGYRDGASEKRFIEAIHWRCTEFAPIHSEVGATRHIQLGRWPLNARQGAFAF